MMFAKRARRASLLVFTASLLLLCAACSDSTPSADVGTDGKVGDANGDATDAGVDATLALGGSGPEAAALEALARELGVWERVRFAGEFAGR